MELVVNKVYEPLFRGNTRYYILMGGRGAGRSTVASQYANSKLVAPEYFRCAIMRYILGDIRNSIYQEIKDRLEENGELEAVSVNDSLMTLEYGANNINAHGFRKSSGEQKAKLKSLANYNCVIIEEADEIPEEDFMQLDDTLRTLKGDLRVILLLNPPPRTHWIINRWFKLDKSEVPNFYIPSLKPEITDTTFIHTSYINNKSNISPQTITNYENYKETKPDHYYNMVRGLVPETTRGRIFSNWKFIDEIPHEARLISVGGDYGYTNDPTALVAIYYLNGGFIVDEITYTKGLSNKQIAEILLAQPPAPFFPDSAEPKSNDEIRLYGITVMNTTKGKGSITQGIEFVKAQKISVTKRSVNIIKEYENYAWYINKDGVVLNEPKPGYDHAMDAIRYGLQIKGNLEPTREYNQPDYESPTLR